MGRIIRGSPGYPRTIRVPFGSWGHPDCPDEVEHMLEDGTEPTFKNVAGWGIISHVIPNYLGQRARTMALEFAVGQSLIHMSISPRVGLLSD